jgi:integrase
MAVRKRTWKTAAGEPREAWVIDYRDAGGNRRFETFDKRKDADARHATVKVELRQGVHTPNSASLTIEAAGQLWIKSCEGRGLERTTIRDYKLSLKLHITPFLGTTKLSELSVPMVRAFEDKLRDNGRSPAMVRRARVALSTLIADAMERGLVNRNVVRELSRKQELKADQRAKGQLEIGRDIPSPDEIRKFLPVLRGRWRGLLLTATFCRLRSSELRGLRWQDINFAKAELRVVQRADRYHQIGPPKSKAGTRTIPCRRRWSTHSRNGAWLVRGAMPISRSRTCRARSRAMATSSIGAWNPPWCAPASSLPMARRNTGACTASATSSRRGALTPSRMAVLGSMPSGCSNSWGTRISA